MNVNDGRYDPAIITGTLSPDGRDILLGVVGQDWQMAEAAAALRHMTALPRMYKKRYNGQSHVPCTWALVTQLARTCERHGMTWRPDERLNAWTYEEFLRRYAEGDSLSFDLSCLERTPMPHQVAGAYVAARNRRFFFADQAGTGKTMTMLLTLAEMADLGYDPFPAFVVAPASVVDPWLEELAAVFPDWPVVAYRGSRRRLLSTRYKVYVMSWETFRTDMSCAVYGECVCGDEGRVDWTKAMQKLYDAGKPRMCPTCDAVYEMHDTAKTSLPPLVEFLAPRTLVLDEAHQLCNVTTKQSSAARRLARITPYALLASGTPITHDVGGFWSALNVLDVRSFPDQDRYKENYADTSRSDYGNPVKVEGLTTTNRDEFYTLLQGSMRRVAKSDVLKDLPPKTYSTRVVQIPPAYRAAYDEMQQDMLAHLPDSAEPLPVMSTLAQLQRLTQLASSACDVEVDMRLDENPESVTYGEMVPHYTVTMKDPSWKVDELMSIVKDNEGSPLITTAPHAQLMTLAGARAERDGYRVGYIKGGQSASARTAVRQSFQDGELDLLCVTTSAGGVGLTLTAACTMVCLERPFAFWQADQMEDRIHRKGQTQQVHIIDVVAANTVESRIRETLLGKAESLAELLRSRDIVESFLKGQPVHV